MGVVDSRKRVERYGVGGGSSSMGLGRCHFTSAIEVDCGFWVVNCGLWIVDCGLRVRIALQLQLQL